MNLNLIAFIQEMIYQKIKDMAYTINFDEYESIGTYWIALYVNTENVTYVDSFEVDCVDTFVMNLITLCSKVQIY